MRDLFRLLALPASLLALISFPQHAHGESWPYDTPPDRKYFPEHEPHIKRNLDIQSRLAIFPPLGMRKMSDDDGEKFLLDYWQFDPSNADLEPLSHDRTQSSGEDRPCSPAVVFHNDSSKVDLLPPMLLHRDTQQSPYLPKIFGRDLFERDYKCPNGTSDCSSIGYKYSCCDTDATCILVQDTGSGSVGCCSDGENCGGEVTGCDTTKGYTSCPGSSNGGCCIPGYACQGVGCIYVGSTTTTTTLPVVTVSTGETTTSKHASTTTTTSTASVPTVSVKTVTTTIVLTPSESTGVTTVTDVIIVTLATSTSTSATTQSSLTCASAYHSCASSLGGGCCSTDRVCGTSNLCLASSTSTATTTKTASSTTASAVAPVRPTGDSSSTSMTSSTSTVTYSGCPTGFYMCSAYYLGGCCRVGRNCDTTSCPSSASTSVVVVSGLTIVALSGASTNSGDGSSGGSVATYTSTTTTTSGGSVVATTTGGSCANEWFSCAASVGGGCCPSGYECGASCTATISGQNNVGKESESAAGRTVRVAAWLVSVVGIISGVGMVLL